MTSISIQTTHSTFAHDVITKSSGHVAPREAQRRCFIVVLCCGLRLAKPLVETVFADAGIATRSRETAVQRDGLADRLKRFGGVLM
jgi:hypothetical protein